VSAVLSSVSRVASNLRFSALLWMHHGEGGWPFVTLPPEAAHELRDSVPPRGPGFGAIRVTVTVGDTTWGTSVFPDTATGSFVLPVKKAVRVANRLVAGDEVQVLLRAG
jgi:Domain of unknown function (DUF1905)